MGIVPKFTKSDIAKMMKERLLRIDTALVLRLKRIGETFVRNARESGQYNDVTGNLRNSVGYLILRDGVQLTSDFKATAKGRVTSTINGTSVGKQFALDVSKGFPKGYVLIVVAGMEYAASVESRGKDVLTASSITAKNQLKEAVKSLSSKITRMK